jgi:hypothetical protein
MRDPHSFLRIGTAFGPVADSWILPPGFRRLAPDGLVPTWSPLSPLRFTTPWPPPREGPALQSLRAEPGTGGGKITEKVRNSLVVRVPPC